MTILLTGATGFIGRHLLSLLLADGHSVRAVVRDSAVIHLPNHSQLRPIGGGLSGPTVADIKGCDVLVHLAAHGVTSGMHEWESCFRVNVSESLALWIKACDAGVQRFVICGSCFEYGRAGERYESIPVDAPLEPIGPYHASKAAASMAAIAIAIERYLSLSLLRPFHVFGEGEKESRFWPSLRAAALAGRDFQMTKGEQVRDFIEIGAVADQFLATLGARPTPGRPVIKNVGTGHPQTVREFAEDWWARWGARGQLLIGALPYRQNEAMRLVGKISSDTLIKDVRQDIINAHKPRIR